MTVPDRAREFCERLKADLAGLDAWGGLAVAQLPTDLPPGVLGVARPPTILAADVVAGTELARELATWLGQATGAVPTQATFNVGGAAIQVYPCDGIRALDEWHLVPRGRGCLAFHPLEDGAWHNQPCLIVGGGPSVARFDWAAYQAGHRFHRVIAASRAGDDIPRDVAVDIWLSCDRPFWEAGRRRPGSLRVWVGPVGDPPLARGCADRSLCWHGHQWAWEPPATLRDGVAGGGNSGHAALSLALQLGAHPVYLLGYDCTPGTWASAPGKLPPPAVFDRWMAATLRLAAWAAERGQRVKWIDSGAAAPREVLYGPKEG